MNFSMTLTATSLLLLLCAILLAAAESAALLETERLAEYETRNHTWPPLASDYTPSTEGWRRIYERRFRQLDALDRDSNSYNGYMSGVHAGLLCPNFTENGWGLTRAPQGLVDELKASLMRGLAKDDLPIEADMADTIETPNRPNFIYQGGLNQRTHQVIHPIIEAWSGTKLKGSSAYGLRIYRNESVLNMHLDKFETHVISAILHVGHDGEPWPLVIEDFQGNANEVALEEGDLLLCESSKCVHGRPKRFNGSYYSSIFLHYYPIDWGGDQRRMDAHYRIPAIWHKTIPSPDTEELQVVDTSVREPECEHAWCALKNSVKWSGPAEAYGKVLSAGGVTTELDLPSEEELLELGAAFEDEL
jgi:hypothetical protein